MKYLLDASTLVPMLSEFGERLIVRSGEMRLLTTDLAVYEAGNSLWKLSSLRKSISLQDALEVMGILGNLIARGIIRAVRFGDLDLAGSFRLASEEKLTFYDASYVIATRNATAILVTGDRKLREAASKYVDIMTYTDFRHRALHSDRHG